MGLENEKTLLEKEKFADYQHFLLFQQCLQKLSFPGVLKVEIVWQRVTSQLPGKEMF